MRPKLFNEIVNDLWEYFNDIKGADYVAKNSIPILFFGDLDSYFKSPTKIITVAKNPSHSEFPADVKRFDTLNKNITNTDVYIEILSQYFKNNPYTSWFNNFEKLLQHLDASFYGNSYPDDKNKLSFKWMPQPNCVLHTDICSPIATNPTWNDLSKAEQRELLNKGESIWHELIKLLEPDLILISSKEEYKNNIVVDNNWSEILLSQTIPDISPRHKLKCAKFATSSVFWISSNVPPIAMKDADLPQIASLIKSHKDS